MTITLADITDIFKPLRGNSEGIMRSDLQRAISRSLVYFFAKEGIRALPAPQRIFDDTEIQTFITGTLQHIADVESNTNGLISPSNLAEKLKAIQGDISSRRTGFENARMPKSQEGLFVEVLITLCGISGGFGDELKKELKKLGIDTFRSPAK